MESLSQDLAKSLFSSDESVVLRQIKTMMESHAETNINN